MMTPDLSDSNSAITFQTNLTKDTPTADAGAAAAAAAAAARTGTGSETGRLPRAKGSSAFCGGDIGVVGIAKKSSSPSSTSKLGFDPDASLDLAAVLSSSPVAEKERAQASFSTSTSRSHCCIDTRSRRREEAERRECADRAEELSRYISELRRDIMLEQKGGGRGGRGGIRTAAANGDGGRTRAADAEGGGAPPPAKNPVGGGWQARAKQLTAEFDSIVASMKMKKAAVAAAAAAASPAAIAPEVDASAIQDRTIQDSTSAAPLPSEKERIVDGKVRSYADSSSTPTNAAQSFDKATQAAASASATWGGGDDGVLEQNDEAEASQDHDDHKTKKNSSTATDETETKQIPLDELHYLLSRLNAENENRERQIQSLSSESDRLRSILDREKDVLCDLKLAEVKDRAEMDQLRRYIDQKSNEIGKLRKSMRRYGRYRRDVMEKVAETVAGVVSSSESASDEQGGGGGGGARGRRTSMMCSSARRAHSEILLTAATVGAEVRAIEVEPVRRRRTEIQRRSFEIGEALSSEVFEQISAAAAAGAKAEKQSDRDVAADGARRSSSTTTSAAAAGGHQSLSSTGRGRSSSFQGRRNSLNNRRGSTGKQNGALSATKTSATASSKAKTSSRARSPLGSRRKLRSALRKIDHETQRFHESARTLLGTSGSSASSVRNLSHANDSARSLLSAPAALIFSQPPPPKSKNNGEKMKMAGVQQQRQQQRGCDFSIPLRDAPPPSSTQSSSRRSSTTRGAKKKRSTGGGGGRSSVGSCNGNGSLSSIGMGGGNNSMRDSFTSQCSMTSVLTDLSLTDLLEDEDEEQEHLNGNGSVPRNRRGQLQGSSRSMGGSLRDILGVDGDEPLVPFSSPGAGEGAGAANTAAARTNDDSDISLETATLALLGDILSKDN